MPKTQYDSIAGFAKLDYNYIWLNPLEVVIDDGANPRDDLDAKLAWVAELEQKIDANGWRPERGIVVYRGDDRYFHIMDGECRVLAVRNLIARGKEYPLITAFVRPRMADPVERFFLSIAANDSKLLSPMEIARGVDRFLNQGVPLETIAQRLGKSPQTVRNLLLLLEATPALTDAMRNGAISQTAAIQVVKQAEREGVTQAEALQEHQEAKAEKKAFAKMARKGSRMPQEARNRQGAPMVTLDAQIAALIQEHGLTAIWDAIERYRAQGGGSHGCRYRTA